MHRSPLIRCSWPCHGPGASGGRCPSPQACRSDHRDRARMARAALGGPRPRVGAGPSPSGLGAAEASGAEAHRPRRRDLRRRGHPQRGRALYGQRPEAGPVSAAPARGQVARREARSGHAGPSTLVQRLLREFRRGDPGRALRHAFPMGPTDPRDRTVPWGTTSVPSRRRVWRRRWPVARPARPRRSWSSLDRWLRRTHRGARAGGRRSRERLGGCPGRPSSAPHGPFRQPVILRPARGCARDLAG